MMDTPEEGKASLLRTVVLVIGAHIVLILTDGLTLCFGVYLNDLADELNAGLGVLGAASSLLTTVLHLFSPICTLIVLKIGYRRTIMLGTLLTSGGLILSSRVQSVWQLFISHSFVTGFGVSMVYANTVSYIGISCSDNISIANCVVTAGTAAGLIVTPFLINVLRSMYGWRGSLLLLGACVLHATVISLVIFKDLKTLKTTKKKTVYLEDQKFIEVRADDDEKKEIIEEKKGTKELLKEFLKLPLTYPLFGFMLIVSNVLFISFAGATYHLVSHAVDIGISEHNAALLMTIFGIGNLVSRLFNGVPINFNWITSSKLFALMLLTASVCTFLIPFCTRYVYLAAIVLLFGWSIGSVPLIYLTSREIVGVRNFSKAMGVLLFSTAPSGVVGGFFTGWIYDVSGSYNTAFFAMGSLFFVAFLFQVLPRIYLKYKIRDIYTGTGAAKSAIESAISTTIAETIFLLIFDNSYLISVLLMALKESKDDETTMARSTSLIRTVLLVVGTHSIFVLTDGTTISFGIFLTDFVDELNTGFGVIGAASSLLTSALHTFSPVGAYVASKIGYRKTIVIGTLLIAIGFVLSSQVQETWQLFISHSLITGCGISLVFSNTLSFVCLVCDDKHVSIANGVTTAGTAVGMISVPVLIDFLRGIFGWRGSLLIMGALVVNATVISLIVFRNNPNMQQQSKRKHENLEANDHEYANVTEREEESKNDYVMQQTTKLIRLPILYPMLGFLMVVANLVLLAFAGTVYHLVAAAIQSGITESNATLLMTIYGIGNIISRMLHGVPLKLKLIKTKNLFAIALLTAGVSTFVLSFCKSYLVIASVTLIIGMSTGTCVPLIFLSTKEIVGVENFARAVGLLLMSTGFAGLVGGSLAGLVYDLTGSYNIAFFIMGSFFFLGCFFLTVPQMFINFKRNNSEYRNIKLKTETISVSHDSAITGTVL
ncbi:uncharacterized protein [Antedon mediterranea]|uniref:uncharacterized protein n=1 Tax=Antedon mediterranea TaxID=105859 RepID=UPI003AF54241